MGDISQWDVLLRVLVAGGLGALIGLERERQRRAAGVRTHALVALGSSLLTATTILFMNDEGSGGAGEAARIAAGIVTGVGFIGAGTILTSQGRVRGLTTAATVWVTAGIGITAGYGYLLLAALVAGPVTITILLLGIAEHRLEASLRGPDEEAAEESRGTSEDDEKDGSPASAGVTRG
jgi:putative Mg2+ transporter-C (MgtC) family protein